MNTNAAPIPPGQRLEVRGRTGRSGVKASYDGIGTDGWVCGAGGAGGVSRRARKQNAAPAWPRVRRRVKCNASHRGSRGLLRRRARNVVELLYMHAFA